MASKTSSTGQASVVPWPMTEERPLHRYKVFDISGRMCVSPRTGESHEFYVLNSADWVNVIPVTTDGRVMMVRQFRHGIRDLSLEIPGGLIDPGETPLEAAKRELLEETGCLALEWVPLGYIHPNPAIQSNRCFTFLALDTRQVGALQLDGTEEIEVVPVAKSDLGRLVAERLITHSLVVVALHTWHLFEQGHSIAP